MSLGKIVSGRVKEPYLVLLYGTEGVGKSTFASCAPNPIFIGTEHGSSFLNVDRFAGLTSYKEVLSALKSLSEDSHSYKTIVIDSLDWLEPLVWDQVLAEKGKGKTSIEDIGYAKGYIFALSYWREIIKELSLLRMKGMNILLIGHSIIKTFHDPSLTEGYDRYQIKLHDKASALFKEFVDFILFANFETFLFNQGDTFKKAKGGGGKKRILYTQRRPSFDAKSRVNLPFEIDFSWKVFDNLCQKSLNETNKDVLVRIKELIEQLTDETMKKKVIESVTKYKDDLRELKGIEINLLNVIG